MQINVICIYEEGIWQKNKVLTQYGYYHPAKPLDSLVGYSDLLGGVPSTHSRQNQGDPGSLALSHRIAPYAARPLLHDALVHSTAS